MRKAAARRAEKAPVKAGAQVGAPRPAAAEVTTTEPGNAWSTFALGDADLAPEASATWQALALGISRIGDGAESDADAVASGASRPPRHGPLPTLPAGWRARLGPGRALTLAQRQRLPPALRGAASHAQIHSGAAAARTARALHANAFALGAHIGLGEGHRGDEATLHHELAHVALSAGESRAVLRGAWLYHPDVFAQDGPERALYHAVRTALHDGLGETTREGFVASAHAQLAVVADEWGDETAAGALRPLLARCLAVTAVGSDGRPHDTFDLLAAYAVLQRHAGVDELSDFGLALGLDLLLRALSEDIAVQLTPPLTPEWESSLASAAAGQARTLESGFMTTSSEEELYRLELDGTLTALTDARMSLITLTPPDDAPQRERIARLSRRALLLQAAIDDLRSGRGSAAAADLPARMARAGDTIARARGTAQDETRTVTALGDDPSLLALRTVEPGSALGISGGAEILPEQAFAATTDRATTSMLAQASSVAASALASADALRAELVPENPAYTLDEFAAVYRRWFAFFSPEQERADPILTMLLAFFDPEAMADATTGRAWRTWPEAERRRLLEQATPWALTGVPSGLSSFSGGAARVLMLSIFLPMIERHLGRAGGGDFTSTMPRATAAPLTAGGSAASPRLDLSAGFEADGQREDATTATVRLATEAAGRFRDVARTPTTGPGANAVDVGRLLGADPARLREPDAPLVGVRETSAAEGWSYLVDVLDPLTGEPIAREHRVMPLEVARYLMERRRVAALTTRPFVPTAPNPAGGPALPIGDASVRSRGLEATTGTNAAVLAGQPPDIDRRVEANARSLSASRARGASAPGASELISACVTYLDGYFETRASLEWRLAGVLILANIEHGIERDVREAFNPTRLAKAAAYAAAVTTGMAILDSLGPGGRIVSAGVRGYMAAHNCSPVASLAGIMAWLRMVGDIETHDRARTMALISRTIVGDLQNLLDEVASNAASRAAGEVYTRIRDRRPSTTAQLMDAVGDIARDPAARAPMQRAIEAEMQTLRDAGRTDSDDYRMFAAMQSRVLDASRPTGTGDAPLVGVRGADEVRVDAIGWRPRTAAQRAELEAEVPADLRGRVRVVDDPLLSGTTTRVVVGENEVRIHVGPDARAPDVRAHVEVAREQSRFVGVLGRLRGLVDRIRTAITGRPGHGTRGREAQLEVEKLERMLADAESARDDIERRSADMTRAPDAEGRAEIDRHIESIEAQIALHARDMLSLEAGRGFVAATDAAATVRDTLTRAGLRPGESRTFIAAARRRGQLDALADLINAGVYARLRTAGVTPERMVEVLDQPGGYATLVRADRNPEAPDARRLLGRTAADAMRDARRAEARVDVSTSPADRIRGEWGVGADGRFSDAEMLTGTGLSVRQARNRMGSATETTTPRIVWRWRRYIEGFDARERARMNTDANFRRWAQRGYQANLNRDASSPYEAGAMAAVGASPNNAGFDAGGRSTYDYREWVDDTGSFVRSRADAARRPAGARDLYDTTTRPDGIRAREDGGFDVIEHKHLSGTDRTLNDSIQLRAQREMARTAGRGRHVLVLSSDIGLSGGLPTADVSRTLANAPECDIFFYDGTRITHRYDASRTPPWQTYSE